MDSTRARQACSRVSNLLIDCEINNLRDLVVLHVDDNVPARTCADSETGAAPSSTNDSVIE